MPENFIKDIELSKSVIS